MSLRDAFLSRVRQAVAEGNRAGGAPPLPARGSVGYQGAGTDPVTRLRDELTAAGGHFHLADSDHAVEVIDRILAETNPRRVLLGSGLYLDKLDLQNRLRGPYLIQTMGDLPGEHNARRSALFAADVGISGVDFVVAETGTLALTTRPDQPRGLSLLVPIHIAVAWQEQITADLFDLFASLDRTHLPSCLSLITGPSKTGDIELKLVTGVHGPGVVHLVLLRD